jgi:hypothetical protein
MLCVQINSKNERNTILILLFLSAKLYSSTFNISSFRKRKFWILQSFLLFLPRKQMCKFKELQISLAEHAVGWPGEETTVAFHRLTGADAGTNSSPTTCSRQPQLFSSFYWRGGSTATAIRSTTTTTTNSYPFTKV